MDILDHYLVESSMKKLNDKELMTINGGSISGTLINSIIRGVSLIVDIGRAIGTAFRRISSNKICSV